MIFNLFKMIIQPKKSIERLERYIPPLEGRRGMLRLDFNENTVGPSPRVLEALRNVSLETISTYPEYSKFYERLSEHLNIKETQLFVTNASDEAIKLIMDTYIEKGDEIVLPVPTFPMFKIYANAVSARITNVMYHSDLSFPAKEVINSISNKTRIVVIVNPNNPTGTPVKKDDIIRIIKKAQNSLIMLDEAYSQFSKDSCLGLIKKFDNLAIIQTFSKAFGLAGMRIGYIVSNEQNIKNIRRSASPYSVNSLAMLSAETALDDKEYIEWYVSEVEKSKKMLYDELKGLNIKTYPSSANFVLAYFGERSKDIQNMLKEYAILVRDRSSEPLLDGCIRISIGTVKQTKRLIIHLKKCLNNKL